MSLHREPMVFPGQGKKGCQVIEDRVTLDRKDRITPVQEEQGCPWTGTTGLPLDWENRVVAPGQGVMFLRLFILYNFLRQVEAKTLFQHC